MHKSERGLQRGERAVPLSILLFVCGILINLLGNYISVRAQLPVYLDAIGTVLTAATCGYLPGIAVGFFTNVIEGLPNVTAPSYNAVIILVAIFAAHFAARGYTQTALSPELLLLTKREAPQA
jgi:hypothetical protein